MRHDPGQAGRVQGVGFRAWTQRQATARGLSGFVRNQRGGLVEAAYSGDADAVVAKVNANPGDILALDAVIVEFE